jgi:DNA-binding MarR family transcriptional regulator
VDAAEQLAPQESDLVEAFLLTSRALMGIAVRSLEAAAEEVTLPQFRLMVILHARGTLRITELAALLGVNSSTTTRHADRLMARGLVGRGAAPEDGRAVTVSLTRRGERLVRRVLDTRRGQIRATLAAMPDGDTEALVRALRSFATAAGEHPDQHAAAEWGLHPVG